MESLSNGTRHDNHHPYHYHHIDWYVCGRALVACLFSKHFAATRSQAASYLTHECHCSSCLNGRHLHSLSLAHISPPSLPPHTSRAHTTALPPGLQFSALFNHAVRTRHGQPCQGLDGAPDGGNSASLALRWEGGEEDHLYRYAVREGREGGRERRKGAKCAKKEVQLGCVYTLDCRFELARTGTRLLKPPFSLSSL